MQFHMVRIVLSGSSRFNLFLPLFDRSARPHHKSRTLIFLVEDAGIYFVDYTRSVRGNVLVFF